MKRSIGAKTIVFPAPVFIVGTYDKEGRPNAMNAAWGGICCSQPPCIYVSLREATYTFGNILHRKAFTVSIPSERYAKEADHFGLVSGRNEDKFAATGLTPVKSDMVDAPYVGEFPFIVECVLYKTVPLGLHTQFIGEVKDVKADETALRPDGVPDLEKIKPFSFNPADGGYYAVRGFLGKAFSIGRSKP